MINQETKGVLNILKALIKRATPFLKRIRAERTAAGVPDAQRVDDLDLALEATIERLANISILSLWEEALREVEIGYIIPKTLSINSLQTWLQDHTVRQGVKSLAKQRIFPGTPIEGALVDRLAGAFHRHTGESIDQGHKAVAAIVAIVVADWHSKVGLDNRIAVGLLQESNLQNAERYRALKDAIERPHSDSPLVVAHSRECEKVLTNILQSRSIPTIDVHEQIAHLVERVSDNGDLSHCSSDIRGRVLYWAARLYSVRSKNIQTAKGYRSRLLEQVT